MRVDDITSAILSAWDVVGPRLRNDPIELAKRLARRQLKTLRRPLRAWCVALRAADTRIHPGTACCVPEDFAYPKRAAHDYQEYFDHEVVVTAALMRRLCRPVQLDPYGHTARQVGEMLGVDQSSLQYAIKGGVFRVEMLPRGLYGKRIKVLRSELTFDPSSCSLKSRPDQVWGANWGHLADMVPDDFEQAVERVPHFRPDRHSRCFNGWRWVCPGCAKWVRTVYYPIAPINLPEYFAIDPAKLDCDKIQHPPGTLACCRCHDVRYFYRLGPNAWNEMIHHVSGGLLYGYEVPRPAWVTHDRKRPYRPHNRKPPSRRREQVRERLLRGWAYAKIAHDLGIGLATVRSHVEVIYKQHHVHSRDELIRMLRPGLAADATGIRKKQREEPRMTQISQMNSKGD